MGNQRCARWPCLESCKGQAPNINAQFQVFFAPAIKENLGRKDKKLCVNAKQTSLKIPFFN